MNGRSAQALRAEERAQPSTARPSLTRVEVTIAGRAWSILTAEDQDALLDCASGEYVPYGFLLWESAVALAERVARAPEQFAGKQVLELGAGLGLPGLVAATLGAVVTQTDGDRGALDLAGRNAAANGIDGVQLKVADWRDWSLPDRFDWILGSDVIYDRAIHSDLEAVLRCSLRPGSAALLTDPCRISGMEFVAGLEERGWRLDLETARVPGPTSERQVDVALWTVRLPET